MKKLITLLMMAFAVVAVSCADEEAAIVTPAEQSKDTNLVLATKAGVAILAAGEAEEAKVTSIVAGTTITMTGVGVATVKAEIFAAVSADVPGLIAATPAALNTADLAAFKTLLGKVATATIGKGKGTITKVTPTATFTAAAGGGVTVIVTAEDGSTTATKNITFTFVDGVAISTDATLTIAQLADTSITVNSVDLKSTVANTTITLTSTTADEAAVYAAVIAEVTDIEDAVGTVITSAFKTFLSKAAVPTIGLGKGTITEVKVETALTATADGVFTVKVTAQDGTTTADTEITLALVGTNGKTDITVAEIATAVDGIVLTGTTTAATTDAIIDAVVITYANGTAISTAGSMKASLLFKPAATVDTYVDQFIAYYNDKAEVKTDETIAETARGKIDVSGTVGGAAFVDAAADVLVLTTFAKAGDKIVLTLEPEIGTKGVLEPASDTIAEETYTITFVVE